MYKHPNRIMLILVPHDQVGGTERVALNLAHALQTRGWTSRLVFPHTQNRSTLLSWCMEQGVRAVTTRAFGRWDAPHTWLGVMRLARYIRRHHPDVVNLHFGTHHPSFKDVLAVRLAGHHRCIVTVNHAAEWKGKADRKRLAAMLVGLLANEIIVISAATQKTMMAANIPARKTHVIPCGLRVPKRFPTRAEARTRLGLSPDAFVIASIGRLVLAKGFAELIRSAAQVSGADLDLQLLIGGDGPDRPRFEELAAQYLGHRARLLGRIPDEDIADIYAAADVFGLPSHSEGFGLIFVEAAFYAVPCIGTDVGGISDAIVHGETGILVPLGDEQALTSAIQLLHDDPLLRVRLGHAARTRALTQFTEERMAIQYEYLLHDSVRSTTGL